VLPVDRIAAELAGCHKSAPHRERHVAVEWQLLKVQRTLAWQDGKCQVPAAAVIGLQNLTGLSQPLPVFAFRSAASQRFQPFALALSLREPCYFFCH
jgi:hypothetical protein